MRLTYASLCIALFSTCTFAKGMEAAPASSTQPGPPASTGCPPVGTEAPPASTGNLPPHRRSPAKAPQDQARQDEKLIPGSPMHPLPPRPLPPPPPCHL
ncbi:MAG TPA: hypothetical protein VGV16_11055 [Gammaproteobacteria bacterium]|nr:hypothetical protein [Gammaproteobacteria bacterium]